MKKLNYIHTFDMSAEEVKQWEAENKGFSVCDDNGNVVIELQKTFLYEQGYFENNKDNLDESMGIPTIGMALYDDMSERELYSIFSCKEDIVRLRDYLNKILEDFEQHQV